MKKLLCANALAFLLAAGSAAAVAVHMQPAMAGLAKLVEPSGVVVIQATLPGSLAADCVDAECSNGPVAKAIVGALENSHITIAGLFDRINTGVVAATDGRQVPWMTAKAAIDVPLAGNTSHSFALVIGNGAYKHFPALTGAPRDGAAVGKSLENLGFQTTRLIDSDREPLTHAIDSFLQRVGAGDTVVIYYSGHGFSVSGAGYLPPLGGELTDVDALSRSSTAVDTLIDALSRSEATRKVLILDTHFPPLGTRDAR